MNVTPTPKMFEAMSKFTDAICGEAPHDRMIGPGAEKVRENRRMMMDFLHSFAHKCMREGAARAMREEIIHAQQCLASTHEGH